MTKPRIYAVLTARGGSQGLSRKNLRPLHGVPLLGYSIKAAQDCPYIDRCLVSTEDEEIKLESLRLGAEIIHRPVELATDTALSRDVVAHALEILREERDLPEYFVLLQPTSPLRTARHLSACLEAFFSSGANCAISVTECDHHPYKTFLMEGDWMSPLLDAENLEKPRQLLPYAVRENGAIYAMSTTLFLERKTFYVPPAMPFSMTREDSIDIDCEMDLEMADAILSRVKSRDNKETP